jgi:hypothetical protein
VGYRSGGSFGKGNGWSATLKSIYGSEGRLWSTSSSDGQFIEGQQRWQVEWPPMLALRSKERATAKAVPAGGCYYNHRRL